MSFNEGVPSGGGGLPEMKYVYFPVTFFVVDF
jgi:hypothetical protein